ncbi:Transcriptional Regulator, AraC family [hydrothermal vent metagenome]|uniref:Transcriptional Regulator, AraC family n=1 Tax=hydrothermal vent metagenome TaxID=652676 RepID=A0A1W1EE75_9ZZZZ
MSSDLFPAGLIVETFKLNIEEIVEYFNAWNLKSKQMEKGFFSSNITAIHTPRIQFHDVSYSHGFLTQGTYPNDSIMLGYVQTDGKAIFQNRLLYSNELVISSNGDEIDYLSNTKSRIYTISIEKQFFEDTFFAFFNEDFEKHQVKGRFFIKPEELSAFLKSIKAWMTFIKHSHVLLLNESKYKILEVKIVEDIFSFIKIEHHERKKSEFQIKKARDILHANIDECFDAEMLTQKLGIGQRQLQRIFKESYGYSPKKYLLNLRINAVRKELIEADPESATISTIAMKYHFFDLNHFSKAYKALFCELPSQTLQR